jgi:hypothetical protein
MKTKRRKIYSPVLVNAAAMARQHPKTFGRPSKQELGDIQPGALVKVSDDKERFWTEVISRDRDIIVARVDSAIGFGGQEYGYDDLIQFGIDNVYDIYVRSLDSTPNT